VHVDVEPVHVPDSEGCSIYSERNIQEGLLEMQNTLPTAVTMVPVICPPGRTQLTNFSGDQNAWPQYLTMCIIPKDICYTPRSVPRFRLGRFQIPWNEWQILMWHGIPLLELWCPCTGTQIYPVLAWNGIVPMDSRVHVILIWLPGSGIIQKMSWLLTSHMAHTRCVNFLMLCVMSIQDFDHWIAEEIRT